MKTASGALQTLLNAGTAAFVADLYTIILANGATYNFTNYDVDLVVAGVTYSHTGPLFKRSSIKSEVGIKTTTVSVTLEAVTTPLVAGTTWATFARLGRLDNATVKISRLYMATATDTSAGAVVLFAGRVSDVKPSRTQVDLIVSAYTELLNIDMPRRVTQPSCMHALYGPGCRVNPTPYTASCVVAAGTVATYLLFTGTASTSRGYYNLGNLTFTSGALNGQRFTIKDYYQVGYNAGTTYGVIYIVPQLPSLPANGDTFSMTPGCDKTLNTCKTKFNNAALYLGFPYVPEPETAL